MTMAMQELLEQEQPDYFTAENIDKMKKEDEEHERSRHNRKGC